MRVRALICACVVLAAGMAFGQAATSASALRAVPGMLEQAGARETIRKTFDREYAKTAAADRAALAMTLLAQGKETHDDMALRYMAFVESADLAAGAGDAVTAVAAIDALAKTHAVNGLELKRVALGKALGTAVTAAESEAVMRLALETADAAAAADAYEMVTFLASVAENAAHKTKTVAVVSRIQGRVAGLREMAAEYVRVKSALDRVARNPADAEAQLVVGRFYALSKGQWAKGLEHLAAGSDAELRELAKKDLERPADGLAQAAVGDAWWAYAEKAQGLAKANASARATEWYKQAEQTIRGITLARIQSRIASGVASEAVVPASAVNLLSLVQVDKDAAQGQWSVAGEALSCTSSAYACLRLPFAPPQEYDLRADFTRLEGQGSIAVLLAANGKAFGFALDVRGEARFERVNEKAAQDNPTVVAVAISNQKRYSLTVEVRKDRVRALLDGKVISEWKTDYRDLSRYSVWKLEDAGVCGVGANNARVTFHRVEMLEVTGKGKALRQ